MKRVNIPFTNIFGKSFKKEKNILFLQNNIKNIMKKIFLGIAIFLSLNVRAQDEGKSNFTLNADFVSSYVWRGLFLSGTSIQPEMALTVGNFTLGAWGSVDVGGWNYKEVDLFASYSIGNFTAGLFNYWADSELMNDYFDLSKTTRHQLELNLLYTFENTPLTLGWNTIIAGDDKYFNDKFEEKRAFSTYIEASYAFSVKDVKLDAAIGASPWKSDVMYTFKWNGGTDKFAVVNLSLTASKEIKITDRYSLGLFGQFAINPAKEDAFFVFGIKF